METNENNLQEKQKDQTKVKKSKENIITGVSSSLGAVAGVVVGTAIAQEASAAETVDSDDVVVLEEPENAQTGEPVHATVVQPSHDNVEVQVVDPTPVQPVVGQDPSQEPSSTPSQEPTSDPNQAPDPTPTPDPTPSSDSEQVQVLNYYTMESDDGGKMDVADLIVEGQHVSYIDTNMDGEANYSVIDANNNGQIDMGESEDVSDQHIQMQAFQDQFIQGQDIADVGPDYTNDADVSSYMS
ncbi:MAG: hypothetical protein LUC91_07645 [Prevotella sp.]|nr:hypothetical protein [Prevotella sp.]